MRLTGTNVCLSLSDKGRKPKISKAQLGRNRELLAATWLRSQGYEVFQNVSYRGPIDLVAISPDEILYIDVKSVGAHFDYGVKSFIGGHKVRPSAKRFPNIQVRLLYTYKDQFAWKIGHLRPDWEFE